MNRLYFIQVGTFGGVKGDFDIEDMINEKTNKSYKDSDVVIKIGMATDIGKRLGQHSKKLGKLSGADLAVINFAAVNPYITSEAETKLKKKLANVGQLVPGYREIYVVDEKSFGKSIDEFRAITEKYPGDFNGLSRQVHSHKKTIKRLQRKYEDSEREVEILTEKLEEQKKAHKKEITLREKAHAKDLEIASLRIENLQLQLASRGKRR